MGRPWIPAGVYPLGAGMTDRFIRLSRIANGGAKDKWRKPYCVRFVRLSGVWFGRLEFVGDFAD